MGGEAALAVCADREGLWMGKILEEGVRLKSVPEGERTAAVCEAAVDEDARNFRHVPVEMRTERLCRRALARDPSLMSEVPVARYRSEKFCLDVLKMWPKIFRHLPGPSKTRAVCIRAVEKDGSALAFVPKDCKTLDLCEYAVSCHREALRLVPEAMRETIVLEGLAGEEALSTLREKASVADEANVGREENGRKDEGHD